MELGVLLHDGSDQFIALGLAGDVLLFAGFARYGLHMLRSLLACLKRLGLVLNASNTVAITTQGQSPKEVWLDQHTRFEVLSGDMSMLFVCKRPCDSGFGSPYASNITCILGLDYFEAVVTAGHRKIYQLQFKKVDDT